MIDTDSEEDIELIIEDECIHTVPDIDLSIFFGGDDIALINDSTDIMYVFTYDCEFDLDEMKEYYGSKLSMHRADEISNVLKDKAIEKSQIVFYVSRNYKKYLNKIGKYVAQAENMYLMNAYFDLVEDLLNVCEKPKFRRLN